MIPDDLENRLFDLGDDDLDMLMASIRVIALCAENGGLNPAVIIPTQHIHQLCGEDLFVAKPAGYLLPDSPPVLTPMCLPGTDRRPLKPWFRCNEDERRIELQIAAMLDKITLLAVRDGVCVPEAEDFLMADKDAPSRYRLTKAYEAW